MTILHRVRGAIPILVSAILAMTGPASAIEDRDPSAPPSDPQARYDACFDLVDRDAAAALQTARGWELDLGGVPARACQAAALLALSRPSEAAAVLEDISADVREHAPETAATALSEAASAWLDAGRPDRAIAALRAAKSLKPDSPDLATQLAGALTAAGENWAALDELGTALDHGEDPAMLVMRAAVNRRIGLYDLALDDVTRALALAPGNPDALLERGNIRRLRGELAAARRDWTAVVEAVPQGDARAVAARVNLSRLPPS